MALPFSQERKAMWHIQGHCDDIEYLLREDDPFLFQIKLRDVYPQLERYGVTMPRIDPVPQNEDDNTIWVEWHTLFLKLLEREIRNETFNLMQWNHTVKANDTYNGRIRAKQRNTYATRLVRK